MMESTFLDICGFSGGGEGFFMLDVVVADTFSTVIFLVFVTDGGAKNPFVLPTTE